MKDKRHSDFTRQDVDMVKLQEKFKTASIRETDDEGDGDVAQQVWEFKRPRSPGEANQGP